MNKFLQRLLGNNRRTEDLEQRLAKAKDEIAKLKNERNNLREAQTRAKPYLRSVLSRMLEAAPHVKLDEDLRRQLLSSDAQVSFSQFGEDCAAAFFLNQIKERGVIVDIGAYHPFRFSNTFLFHLMGWKCVCVDASEKSIALLNQVRPADTHVCALVSDRREKLTFYSFAEGAWNTTNAAAATMLENRSQDGTTLIETTEVETVPINELLDNTVGKQAIDLLDVDVEGMDVRLLLGIDFARHAPAVILAEIQERELREPPLGDHLASGGYQLKGYCGHTAILVRNPR
jgi:FkbM family methyltransferase